MLKQCSNTRRILTQSLCAGILISVGCTVYLSVNDKYIGAFLFAIALFTICYKKYNLFTGKVGYLVSHRTTWKEVVITLVANILGVVLTGVLLASCLPELSDKALLLVHGKLEQDYVETFGRALFCGVLMYTAVDGFNCYENVLFVFLSVVVFILCGFEHSIANIGYYAIANVFPIVDIVIVVLGNTLGSWIIPILEGI